MSASLLRRESLRSSLRNLYRPFQDDVVHEAVTTLGCQFNNPVANLGELDYSAFADVGLLAISVRLCD